jgi:hypothetical protein
MVFNDTFNNISVILVEKTGFVLLPISRVVLFFIAPSVFSKVYWYNVNGIWKAIFVLSFSPSLPESQI